MPNRKFEFSDHKSHKFWNIKLAGDEVTTSYGRVGSGGQSTTKKFDSKPKAQAHYDKLIAQKTAKGYVEGGGRSKKTKAPAKKKKSDTPRTKSTAAKKIPAKKKKAAAKVRRVFEFSSGSSAGKFWAIDLKGKSFEVTYGKIGTQGTRNQKEFESKGEAEGAAQKLIQSKTDKGYVEVSSKGAPSGPDAETGAGDFLPSIVFAPARGWRDWGRLKKFIGKPVVEFESASSIKRGDDKVYRISSRYDDERDEFMRRLELFLETDAGISTVGLIAGNWDPSNGSKCDTSEHFVKAIVKKSSRLQGLKAIFVGDISREENEVSWITQSDLSPLLTAFPKLEFLRVRGGESLQFKSLHHDCLRALTIETAGLGCEVLAKFGRAQLPMLEHLELWLGEEYRGADFKMSDLRPILQGKRLPNLRYLGLRNSDQANELAAAVVTAPVASQVETVDLSLGTMTDDGADALLNLPTDGSLLRLDVSGNYLTSKKVKELKKLPFTVVATDMRKSDDWDDDEPDGYRYVAVGE